MSWEQWMALVAVVSSLVAATYGFLNNMKANRLAAVRVSTEREHIEFTSNIELDRYINEQVDKRVIDRLKDMAEENRRDRAEMRAQIIAAAQVIRIFATQWPADRPRPKFDARVIKALEDSVPSHLLRPSRGTE